jgi:putative ABC transport system substrate-binding protein
MRRRALAGVVAGALAWPLAAHAQPAAKVHRIGYLGTGSPYPALSDMFRQGLRELGWVEGRNIAIEYRFGEGQIERLPSLADELLRLKVDVIVASPTPATLAAKTVTKTIPIVGIGFDNPVETGLVASLTHPGGNVTGLAYSVGPQIFGKDLELLKETIPKVQRVAVLSNSTGPNHALMVSNIKAAARSLGLDILIFDVQRADDLERVIAAMTKERIEALFVFGDPIFSGDRARLANLAIHNHLPTMYTNRPHVEAGGLMCYGPSFPDLWRRAAGYVDKVLKGTSPANLPVEQPTKFELVINLKTAKALDLSIPPAILARADETIE